MTGERRWAAGDLVFPRTLLTAVEQHLCAAHPNEGCGYAVGPQGSPRITAFVPMENLQDRYHARDPVAYPRTARTAYLLHPLQFERAYAQGQAEGTPVKVIVHSHPDRDAYFSAEDMAFAIVDGTPTHDCAYLVVSVQAGRAVDRKLFALGAEGGAYVETPLSVEEDGT